jgi:hypothetical protein
MERNTVFGGNLNGLPDDPLRQFVTKYHWRGVLAEPPPQVFQQLLKTTSWRSARF